MKKQVDKIRDRKRTELKLIAAVGHIIEQQGAAQIGVNLISKTAGVNKVLIYRYFKTVDALVSMYVQTALKNGSDFTKDVKEGGDATKRLTGLMLGLLGELRRNDSLRELLHWEIQYGKTFLFNGLMELIEPDLALIKDEYKAFDPQAMAAVLGTGICMLNFLSNLQCCVLDIEFGSDQGWKRIENVLKDMIAGCFIN